MAKCLLTFIDSFSDFVVRASSLNAKLQAQLLCEADEQWSFVGNKKNQRWLWYTWEPRFKRVIAHAFGRRTEATPKKLLKLLATLSL